MEPGDVRDALMQLAGEIQEEIAAYGASFDPRISSDPPLYYLKIRMRFRGTTVSVKLEYDAQEETASWFVRTIPARWNERGTEIEDLPFVVTDVLSSLERGSAL